MPSVVRTTVSRAHDRTPYTRPTGTAPGFRSFQFKPADEHLKPTGPHPPPDVERARADPYNHYLFRTGKHSGLTPKAVHEKDSQYLAWMKRTQYPNLASDHIVRRLLDQWAIAEGMEQKWVPPPLFEAPVKFKLKTPSGGFTNLYVSGAFIKKSFKVTTEEAEESGMACYQKGNAKNKKFALYHVYRYAMANKGMSRADADAAVDKEVLRMKTKSAAWKNRRVCEGHSGCECRQCFFGF